MIVHSMEQRSPEWFELRRGRVTASSAGKLVTPTGKPSASLEPYLCEVAADYLLGDMKAEMSAQAEDWGFRDPYGEFDNYWMKRGRELESEALAWFKIQTGLDTRTIGMMTVGDRISSSPDAMLANGSYTTVELKCPSPEKHLAYLMEGIVPKEYKAQVHAQMAISESDHAYFMSYCPGLRTLLVKVKRDDFTDTVGDAIDNAADQLNDILEENEHG